MYEQIVKEMEKHSSPEKAKASSWFFKTGKGEYGEGDVFIGLTVPEQRSVAKKYKDASFPDIKRLLKSRIHEHRLTGLLILVDQYGKADEKNRKRIVDFYLSDHKGVNNWDLVDLSAHKILGEYLFDKDRSILYKLAKSDNIWNRRIAIIATFAFMKRGQLSDSIKLAEILMHDKHNLINKAVGWVLREVGKRDKRMMLVFLKKHHRTMPRVTLSYACEKLSPSEKRLFYSDRLRKISRHVNV